MKVLKEDNSNDRRIILNRDALRAIVQLLLIHVEVEDAHFATL